MRLSLTQMLAIAASSFVLPAVVNADPSCNYIAVSCAGWSCSARDTAGIANCPQLPTSLAKTRCVAVIPIEAKDPGSTSGYHRIAPSRVLIVCGAQTIYTSYCGDKYGTADANGTCDTLVFSCGGVAAESCMEN